MRSAVTVPTPMATSRAIRVAIVNARSWRVRTNNQHSDSTGIRAHQEPAVLRREHESPRKARHEAAPEAPARLHAQALEVKDHEQHHEEARRRLGDARARVVQVHAAHGDEARAVQSRAHAEVPPQEQEDQRNGGRAPKRRHVRGGVRLGPAHKCHRDGDGHRRERTPPRELQNFGERPEFLLELLDLTVELPHVLARAPLLELEPRCCARRSERSRSKTVPQSRVTASSNRYGDRRSGAPKRSTPPNIVIAARAAIVNAIFPARSINCPAHSSARSCFRCRPRTVARDRRSESHRHPRAGSRR